MAKGMRKYEALFMVTIFQGSNILSNSLSALVVLQEMDGEPWWKLAGYFICIAGMMFGISILVLGEEACPAEEVDMDLRRIISIEEGFNCAESSESEPEIMDFIHAVAKDPYNHESEMECMAGTSDHTDQSESSWKLMETLIQNGSKCKMQIQQIFLNFRNFMSLGIIGILKCQNGLSDQYVEAKKRCDASVELWGKRVFYSPRCKGMCAKWRKKKQTPSMLHLEKISGENMGKKKLP